MDRYEKDSLYDWYVENCTKNEIPLSYKEWEREIYPKEVAQIKRIKSEQEATKHTQYMAKIVVDLNKKGE